MPVIRTRPEERMDLDSKRALRKTVVTVATTALLTGGAASAAAAERGNPPAAEPDAKAARAPQSEARDGARSGSPSGPDARQRPLPPEVPPRVPPIGPKARSSEFGPSAELWAEVWHAMDALPERLTPPSGPEVAVPEFPAGLRPGLVAERPSEAARPRTAEAGQAQRPDGTQQTEETKEADSTRQAEASGRPEGASQEAASDQAALPRRAHRTAHAHRRFAAGFARTRAKAVHKARHARHARAYAGRHSVKSFAFHLVRRSWGPGQFRCLDRLWTRESNWNHRARNPRSGAYGIPQALPAHKMRVSGHDWRSNPITQVRWGLRYIKSRYGTPCAAWAHFQRRNWY